MTGSLGTSVPSDMLLWTQQPALAKLDLCHAYRVVPVHPADHLLLGTAGYMLTQHCLLAFDQPRKSFQQWQMRCCGPCIAGACTMLFTSLIISFCGLPGSLACAVALQVALATCNELGMPVAVEKLVGPTTRIVFLRIELDSMSMQIRLPDERLCNLKALIAKWSWNNEKGSSVADGLFPARSHSGEARQNVHEAPH